MKVGNPLPRQDRIERVGWSVSIRGLALEVYLAARASGLAIETPAVRP